MYDRQRHIGRIARRVLAFAIGHIGVLLPLSAPHADDVEIFTDAFDPGAVGPPNILLILDDSASMGGPIVAQDNYDPAITYPAGTCGADAGRVYFSRTSSPPGCDTGDYFALTALVCRRALDALASPHGGSYRDRFARFEPTERRRWQRLSGQAPLDPVECQDDLPDAASGWAGHGDGSNAAAVYPRNGNAASPWTSAADAPERITWGSFPADYRYTIYSGNYLNWYYGEGTTTTRLQVLQAAAKHIIHSLNGVNVGLMRFSGDEGGLVAHAVSDIGTSRSTLVAAVDALVASGASPLSETLYEAYQYLSGKRVEFGTDSVTAARRPPPDEGLYDSPLDLSCQKNHIVLLTDGEPVADQSADDEIRSLIDFEGRSFAALIGGSCDAESYPPGTSPDGGECLDDLAEFMRIGDLSPLDGRQQVTTHTVGLAVDLPLLEQTAARGGGEYHTATDLASLVAALQQIVATIADSRTTFTAPALVIDAFHQTHHGSDVYLGLFRPSATAHWPGNLARFRLRSVDAVIVDANDEPVADSGTGALAAAVRDYWTEGQQSVDIMAGGAASRIPAARKVYTYLGEPGLTSASNRVSTANLSDAMLGTGDPALPSARDVVDFINGIDIADADMDGLTAEPRRQLGDPLHSAPVVVGYGPDSDDALIYMGTNDGMLHAFDAADGTEAWAFLPPEFLGQQLELLLDAVTGAKTYGIDGSIEVLTIGNRDGIVESGQGERVLLFFGMRRGGDGYYALDVTDPDSPSVLWRLDGRDLPGLGQSWSGVTPTRIDIRGVAQNAHKLALVIGGGYDASQDAAASSMDASGNALFVVDMLTGELLWSTSAAGGNQQFSGPGWGMNYSLPAAVRVIDIDGDGYGDRMYAADTGGQVWRFDISNGQPPASLMAGGVIAQLGAAGHPAPTLAESRRFYYAPDVALVRDANHDFVHIGIGSGHRAHPNATVNDDAFFALRDHVSLRPMTQGQYDTLIPIRPDDLVDVTTDIPAAVPPGSNGWILRLDDGGPRGEKVLAEARTFDDRVYVATYRPDANGHCEPVPGITRHYVLSLFNAAPVADLDGSGDATRLTRRDRYREYPGLPPPATIFVFPAQAPAPDLDGDGEPDPGTGPNCAAAGSCPGAISCVGLACSAIDAPRTPIRTYWRQQDID